MDITTQGTLTRNLRKPFGTSLLRSGSDWILDQISLDPDLAPAD